MREQKPESETGGSKPAENERPRNARPRRARARDEITQQIRTQRRADGGSLSTKIVSFFRLVLILVGILVCLAIAGGIWAAMRLPQMAEAKFGPPGARLDLQQRVLYSARLLASENSLLTPADAGGTKHAFEVSLGETVNSITTRLEEEGFIRSADALRTYLIYAGLDTGVQAGEYQLSPAMTPIQIAHALQDATPAEVKFIILPGWRAEEIAAALPTSGLKVTPEEFLAVVNNPPEGILPAGLPNVTSLEGFLLPGQYQIKRDISAQDLASLFVKQFDRTVDAKLRDAFTSEGLELNEAVTLASIVQREAMVADEQPTIVSVFYNRLANGMKLDSDPTVQYALGFDPKKQTWWKNPLSQQDLEINSRYNTYIYAGLPPGPIANPGIEALRAVAYPAKTNFFYFRAKCDGSGRHAFSTTYEEHLQNACP